MFSTYYHMPAKITYT